MQISEIVENWDKYLDGFERHQKTIYFSEKYIKSHAISEHTPLCYVYIKNEDKFIFPLLKKAISNTSFFDFETVYGYGGCLATTDAQEFISEAYESFLYELKKESIIAGFVRFDPTLQNQKYLENQCQIIFNRKTIIVSLRDSVDEIWKNQINTKIRNVIRKAIKNELTVEISQDKKELLIFKELYEKTMKRLSADDYFFFNTDYYENFYKLFKEESYVASVKKNDKTIASCIFLKDEDTAHYHLSGSDPEYLKLYPNNLMIWEIIKFAKTKFCAKLHLGGGNSLSESDSLLKFKKNFSKDELDFFIGKILVNKPIYEEICATWREKNPDKVERYGHLVLPYRF